MEQKEIFRSFRKYVSANVASMIGLSCYVLADTYFVANGLGARGLAALNIGLPVYNFIDGLAQMFAIGGATMFSIAKGRGEKDQQSRVFSQMLLFAIMASLVFWLAALAFVHPLARLLGANGQTEQMVVTYIRIALLFAPAFIGNDILSNFVRNDGNPHLAMFARLFSCVFNIVFDYIFIFPLKLGMLGAVLATGFSPLIGIPLLLTHFAKKRASFRFVWGKPDGSMLAKAVSLGFPALITELSAGIVMIVFNFLLLGFSGNDGVAAYGVVANISIVVISIFSGIAQGIQPLVSQAYGQEQLPVAKKIFKYGLGTVLLTAAASYALLFWQCDLIVSLFNHDHNSVLQALANHGVKLYFTGIACAGFNVLLAGYFSSIELAGPAQLISLLRGIFLIVPVAFVLARLFGLTGLWLAFPATELLVSLLGLYLTRSHGLFEAKRLS
ncbi:MATE family efflux transporter [Lactobacillus nasalidis]|uniref:Multidrug export protein MepA n=1 Tax=Lactobacillus nasalidis TaxID=2797258 RepID=A0ABQ3W7T9_9LACO|nr:MATE family efflux transporter [Lactobacillus nasalidis]GHV97395.1 MATE family efflux transporter [Lactobacillus nasalidis]GHV99445.1 MATE family efflux transporter [Lactobacillus nasalidis]GHW01510.1 MATE family efflux transporter [Lactobacillus nasalidis]